MISTGIHRAFTTLTCPPAPAPSPAPDAPASSLPQDTFVPSGAQDLLRQDQRQNELRNFRHQANEQNWRLNFHHQMRETNFLNNQHQSRLNDQRGQTLGGLDSPLWTGSGNVTSQRQLQQEVREGRDLNNDGAIGWPR